MKINEGKLDPDLLRWVREDKAGERTVVIRFAFSQAPDQAAEVLGKAGMEMQSCGPGVVVATSDRESVKQASNIHWVIKIELPRQLNMKSRLRRT
jgi:hypothetical protein